MNFSTDEYKLDSILPSNVKTGTFDIHLSGDYDKSEMEYLALQHEYYLDQIKIALKSGDKEKIDSYIFKSREQKKILLGSGSADIAKPWLRQIYINKSNYEATLKHELAHVLLGSYGTLPLKVADGFNPALIEGMAMYLENDYNDYPVHYMAKLAESAGYKFPVEKLFSGYNFFSKNSAISYIYSGSFIKFLADKYGVDKIKKLYGNTDFASIYNKNLSALAVEYSKFLEGYIIEFNKNRAQLYFGGTTIFRKFCPRAAADEVNRARSLLGRNKNGEALKIFKNVYEYSGSYQSMVGIINCYSDEKRYSEALKLLDVELPNFRSGPYFFYLELLYGDLSVRTGNSEKALSIYDTLLVQNPDIAYTNEVLLRKAILNEGTDSLNAYFDKNETMKFKKLLDLNRKEILYFSIPGLLQLAAQLQIDPDSILDFLRGRMRAEDQISCYALLKVSQYALKKGDYVSARDFAILTFSYKINKDDQHSYIENLRKINWFINNAEDIEITIN